MTRRPRRTADRSHLTVVPTQPTSCDCPTCAMTGADDDLDQLLRELVDATTLLADAEQALFAELAGAMMLAFVTAADEDLTGVLAEQVIPRLEAQPSRGALALLLALGSVATGEHAEVGGKASEAADRLVAGGVPAPAWTGELSEPVRVEDCVRLSGRGSALSLLVATFRRADRGHTLIVFVDDEHGGAAEDIVLVEPSHRARAIEEIRADARADGVNLRAKRLTPGEFRWYAQAALDARAADDAQGLGFELFEEEFEGPPYPVLARLVRARLETLPPPAAGAASASVYQIKVRLLGTKPPIWRRLLVPADTSLAQLHEAIQAAFGWLGGHLHVFETPYGDFGHPDPDLGHASDRSVTLERVAGQVKDRIRYTYDFGDDWEHEIEVEDVLARDPALTHPRCTGGRRAAPPDDCGGVWGYQDLLQILADPSHPEHEERREWLRLEPGEEFDPAAFDVDAVNRALAKLG